MTGGNVGYIPQRVVDSLHSGDSGGIVRWHHHRVCMTVVSGRELQPLSFQFWFTIRTWHIRFCLCNKAFLIIQQWTPWRQVKNLLEPRRSQEYMHTSRERYTYIKGRKYIHTSKENILSFTRRKYTHTWNGGNISRHHKEKIYTYIKRRKYMQMHIKRRKYLHTHLQKNIYIFQKEKREKESTANENCYRKPTYTQRYLATNPALKRIFNGYTYQTRKKYCRHYYTGKNILALENRKKVLRCQILFVVCAPKRAKKVKKKRNVWLVVCRLQLPLAVLR